MTPTPIDELTTLPIDLEQGNKGLIRTARRTAEFCQVVRDVAAETPGVTLIDLWSAMSLRAAELTPEWTNKETGTWLGELASGTSGGFKQLLSDGIHISGEGYRLFYSLIEPHILPGIDSNEPSSWVYPCWRVL